MFGYGAIPEADIDEGVRVVGRVVDEAMSRAGDRGHPFL